MTDFRALCAELSAIEDALSGSAILLSNQGQSLDGYSALANFRSVAKRARAALAQPVPDEPTYEQLYELADEYNGEPVASMQAALARWGRPATTPETTDD